MLLCAATLGDELCFQGSFVRFASSLLVRGRVLLGCSGHAIDVIPLACFWLWVRRLVVGGCSLSWRFMLVNHFWFYFCRLV